METAKKICTVVVIAVLGSKGADFLLFLLFSTVLGQCPITAQNALTADVHVRPRNAETQADSEGPPKGRTIPEPKPIIKDVDLVLLPVSITDQANRPVVGIEEEHVNVFDNGVPQKIRHFSTEDAPVSVVVVLDISGSMSNKAQESVEAITEFLKTTNSGDEFLVITCNDAPSILASFSQEFETTASQLMYQVSKGRTALVDSIYLAMSEVKKAKYSRRAILVISDGGDNHSRYTEGELESLVKEADVQIYSIGIHRNGNGTPEEIYGPTLLHDLAAASGGRDFTAFARDDFGLIGEQIGSILRHQYVIGYRPTSVARDGKWHKVKVKLLLKGARQLVISAKPGYYSPRQR